MEENYMVNGQLITQDTSVFESPAMIFRKGRSTLVSLKVMMLALYQVKNQNTRTFTIEEQRYYKDLRLRTSVSYSEGLVAEIDLKTVKQLLGKENSGSFYNTLKELFDPDPHQSKSLRNSWAVMIPNEKTNVLGYAEVVTACHFDNNNGKLFIKFSSEKEIQNRLFKAQEQMCALPLLSLLGCKSVYTLRLSEIIYGLLYRQHEQDDSLERAENGDLFWKVSIGELLLLTGILDITAADRQVKDKITTAKHDSAYDYNEVAETINSTQQANMASSYQALNRYCLKVFEKEINNDETAAFTVSHETIKEDPKNVRKVTHILFHIKLKNSRVEETVLEPLKPEMSEAEFIFELAKALSDNSMTYNDLHRIAVASKYDLAMIEAGHVIYSRKNSQMNFVDWFEDFCNQ